MDPWSACAKHPLPPTSRAQTLPSLDALRASILSQRSLRETLSAHPHSDQGARSLGSANFVNTTGMTVESCVSFCSAQNFNFAGLEFAQECCT